MTGPGTLDWQPVTPSLVAAPVAAALPGWSEAARVLMAPIDAELADTAAFCERYDVDLAASANCVIIADAVSLTGMEYGGITPIGLPAGWPIYVDAAVDAADVVVIGSGLRRSKLCLPGSGLAQLPGTEVVDGLAR